MPATVLKAAAAGCVCFCVISQHPSVVGSRYFTAPAVIPCDSLRWKMMKKMMPAAANTGRPTKKGKKGKKGKKSRFGMPGLPGMGGMKMSDMKQLQEMMQNMDMK